MENYENALLCVKVTHIQATTHYSIQAKHMSSKPRLSKVLAETSMPITKASYGHVYGQKSYKGLILVTLLGIIKVEKIDHCEWVWLENSNKTLYIFLVRVSGSSCASKPSKILYKKHQAMVISFKKIYHLVCKVAKVKQT